MSRLPDVSVVISTFNRCAALECALAALMAQQVPPGLTYEVIVVDNNSSDETRDVVDRLIHNHGNRLRYVFEPRQGVSFGRNAGIKAARAPIIAFTDDDNVADPTWVATVKDTLERHPEAAAVGGRVLPEWPSPVPRWLDHRHWSPLAILDYGEHPFYTSAGDPRCLLTANLAVRREVLDAIGEFSPDYPRCQDHELLLRLWQAGARALYVPDLVVRAHIAPERLTGRYHRAWHTLHGTYSASMQLQEIIDADGRLMREPADTPRLFGTPGFVYRETLSEARRWAGAMLRLQRSAARHHAHRVYYFLAYIRHHAAKAARENPATRLADLRAFFHASLDRGARRFSIRVSRALGVHLLLALLVGGSLYDVVTGLEHWPFSPYPMFSIVERERTLRSLRVMGVTDEQPPREVPLLDRGMLEPFDQCRLSTAFARTVNNPERRALTREMLHDGLLRYEELRTAARHDGPRLQAVRLYDVVWTLDPGARNVDHPDGATLVEEVHRDTVRAERF